MTMRRAAPVFAWIALAGIAQAGENLRLVGAAGDSRLPAVLASESATDAPVFRARGGADAAPSLLALPPLSFTDIDTDRDGKISFDELYRADAPSLTSLRGQ